MNKSRSSRKWLVLIAMFMAGATAGFVQYQLSVFAPEMMSTMGLSTTQFSSLFTAGMVVGFAFSFIGGTVSDVLGTKRTVTIAYVLTLTGAVAKIFVASYVLLWISIFLTGFATTLAAVNSSRVFKGWFGARMMLAMGIYNVSGVLAQAFSTSFTAMLFPNYRSASVGAAVFVLLAALAWIFFYQDPEKEETEQVQAKEPFLSSLVSVLRNKTIWLISICICMVVAGSLPLQMFLVTYFSERGMDLVLAGSVAGMVSLGNAAASLLSPFAYKPFKSTKGFVCSMGLLAFASGALAWRLESVPLLYAALLLTGILGGILMPLFFCTPALIPGIGVEKAGTAGGIISTFQLIGAIVIASQIYTRIAGDNYELMFLLGACSFLVVAVVGFFLPNLKENNE